MDAAHRMVNKIIVAFNNGVYVLSGLTEDEGVGAGSPLQRINQQKATKYRFEQIDDKTIFVQRVLSLAMWYDGTRSEARLVVCQVR